MRSDGWLPVLLRWAPSARQTRACTWSLAGPGQARAPQAGPVQQKKRCHIPSDPPACSCFPPPTNHILPPMPQCTLCCDTLYGNWCSAWIE